MCEAYGVWQLKKFMGKEYMGVVRSTFLIAPNANVAHTWSNVRTKGHAEKVFSKLQGLVATVYFFFYCYVLSLERLYN